MRRILALALGVLAVWGGVQVALYLSRMAPAVLSLPRRIKQELAIHGSYVVPLSAMAPSLLKAIVATEDRSFWTNVGVSFEGIARALYADVLSGRFVEGGSTITQELVRDQLLTPVKTISRKLRGVVLSLYMTRVFTKRDILRMYLNQVYFGDGAYGVAMAAKRYFGETPARLTLAQSALLAGLPQAPSLLDPLRNLRLAKMRQRTVLQSMVAVGDLTPAQARAAYHAPLNLVRGGHLRA